MKSRKLMLGILVITLVFGVVLTGCPEPEPTYTVWSGNFQFSSTHSFFGTLSVGGLRWEALSQSDFDWEKTNNFSYQSTVKNEWTKGEFKSYLIGKGYTSADAETVASGLVANNHVRIGIRSDSATLIMLLK